MSPGRRKTVLRERPRLRTAWSYVLLADLLTRLWAKRIRCGMVGGIHIFDRYAIDAAVDLEVMYGFRNARSAVKLAPSPTVQVLIKPAAEVVRSQSPYSAVFHDHVSVLELYERYGAAVDAVLTAREPIESMLDGTARLVVTSFVTSSGAETS